MIEPGRAARRVARPPGALDRRPRRRPRDGRARPGRKTSSRSDARLDATPGALVLDGVPEDGLTAGRRRRAGLGAAERGWGVVITVPGRRRRDPDRADRRARGRRRDARGAHPGRRRHAAAAGRGLDHRRRHRPTAALDGAGAARPTPRRGSSSPAWTPTESTRADRAGDQHGPPRLRALVRRRERRAAARQRPHGARAPRHPRRRGSDDRPAHPGRRGRSATPPSTSSTSSATTRSSTSRSRSASSTCRTTASRRGSPSAPAASPAPAASATDGAQDAPARRVRRRGVGAPAP